MLYFSQIRGFSNPFRWPKSTNSTDESHLDKATTFLFEGLTRLFGIILLFGCTNVNCWQLGWRIVPYNRQKWLLHLRGVPSLFSVVSFSHQGCSKSTLPSSTSNLFRGRTQEWLHCNTFFIFRLTASFYSTIIWSWFAASSSIWDASLSLRWCFSNSRGLKKKSQGNITNSVLILGLC